MKTLMIIVCVLAIVTMVYGFQADRYYKFHMNLCECERERRKTYAPEKVSNHLLFKCASAKDGAVFDQYGQYSPYETQNLLKDIIYNDQSVKKAQDIFYECYNYERQVRNLDYTYYIASCVTDESKQSIMEYIQAPY